MRKICIINRKGGVGKTTTAVNLAAGLSRSDNRVLLIDLDPQSSIDLSLNVDSEHTVYDALTEKVPIQQCIVNLAKNFDVISSSESLINAEYHLANQAENKLELADVLKTITGYDYVLLDCPASMGMVNQNALVYAKEAFVPTSTDFFGYKAMHKMVEIINQVKEHFDTEIKITKLIPTLYDKRNKICRETLFSFQTEFPEITGYPIRINSKLKEAPKHGKSIFTYNKSSNGAQDYGRLVEGVIAMETETGSKQTGPEAGTVQV